MIDPRKVADQAAEIERVLERKRIALMLRAYVNDSEVGTVYVAAGELAGVYRAIELIERSY